MISAFQGRDVGFGRPLTPEELARVDAVRDGTGYFSEEAALALNKTKIKPPLTSTPFVRYIHVGVNNDGYWNSMQMALQLEDLVDCLKVLYPPDQYEYCLCFDHKAGHDKKREGALDASAMSKNFGGAQPPMRDTKIVTFNGYLGTHDLKLRVGDTQSFVFTDQDEGPFYLSPEEREQRKFDRPTGKTRNVWKTKQQLIQELKDKGVPLERGKSHKLEELQGFARSHNIPLKQTVDVVIEGWVGKPKGLLQILHERGLIDPVNWQTLYTVNGKKDQDFNIIQESSLRDIMANCTDFLNEETALQWLARNIGVLIVHTPKFHCELAGDGIEYSWAYGKGDFRRQPIQERKGIQNFHAMVQRCTSSDVITKERVVRFSRRARAYTCTYYALDQMKEEEQQVVLDASAVLASKEQQHLFQDIERLQKKFRSRRCAHGL
jgi:hypothetical protein